MKFAGVVASVEACRRVSDCDGRKGRKRELNPGLDLHFAACTARKWLRDEQPFRALARAAPFFLSILPFDLINFIAAPSTPRVVDASKMSSPASSLVVDPNGYLFKLPSLGLPDPAGE